MKVSGVIKNVLAFAVGAGLGALGTAAYFKKKALKECNEFEENCAREYEELRAEQLAEQFREYYNNKKPEKSQGENFEKTSEAHKKQNVDYTRYSKPDVNDVIQRAEARLAEKEGPVEEYSNKPRQEGPRIIEPEEYGNDRTLEPVEFFYYIDNDVLANEDDDEIDPGKIPMLIGNALERFRYQSEEVKDVIYVRNEKQGCDYQITKIRARWTG